MIGLMIPSAFGQTYPTLVLDEIPSAVYAGQSVTFTGKLSFQNQPIGNVIVYIYENDPFIPDQKIGSATTNSNGEFSIPWKVTAGLVETDFDIYAYFDGDDSFSSIQTADQQMTITKYWVDVTLDPFPQVIDIGENVIFSGRVQVENGNPQGFVVYIKDEDVLNADDLMATGYVNNDGRFVANWIASEIDADRIADVYAVVEAKELYYRATTCDDSGITFDFGGNCNSVIPLQVTGELPQRPEITYEESASQYNFSGDEYMQLYYALHFSKSPVVAIVADPDSYDAVKPYLIPTQEGVLIWTDELEKSFSDGNWNVDFDIITPGETFPRKPDIIINVVYNDQMCNEFAGVAYTSGIKPLNSKVCTKYGSGDMRPPSSVAGTAGHEFSHTVGSGHAFNKPGDRMCSVEYGKATCPFGITDIIPALLLITDKPSDFDLAAIATLYGTDGWQDPNNFDIVRNTKLTAKEFLSGQINYGINSTPIPVWIKNNAGWWADGQISDSAFIDGIEWLIQNEIIQIPKLVDSTSISSEIPVWIKNNAGWWADGQISDSAFIEGIEWLIQYGIIEV